MELTEKDVNQIIDGIENFIMDGDPEVDNIWIPYVEKLKRFRDIDLRLMVFEERLQCVERLAHAPVDILQVVREELYRREHN